MEDRHPVVLQILQLIHDKPKIRRAYVGEGLLKAFSASALFAQAVQVIVRRCHYPAIWEYDTRRLVSVVDANYDIAVPRKVLRLSCISDNRNASARGENRDRQFCSGNDGSFFE